MTSCHYVQFTTLLLLCSFSFYPYHFLFSHPAGRTLGQTSCSYPKEFSWSRSCICRAVTQVLSQNSIVVISAQRNRVLENTAAMDHAEKHPAGDTKWHHLLSRLITRVWVERCKQITLEWFGNIVTKPQGWDILLVRQLQQLDQFSSAPSIPSRLAAHAQTHLPPASQSLCPGTWGFL